MYLSFVSPAALWLLLILIPLVGLALIAPRRLGRARFWGSLALRTLLLVALIGAIAGTQLVRRVVWGRSFLDAVRTQARSLRHASQANVPSSTTTVVDRKRARAAARQAATPPIDLPNTGAGQRRVTPAQQGQSGAQSKGTSAPSAASSSPMATDLANWRRARRGVVERPEQDGTVRR